MVKLKKGFSIKIISLAISIILVFTSALYPSPSKDNLRLPIGTGDDTCERMEDINNKSHKEKEAALISKNIHFQEREVLLNRTIDDLGLRKFLGYFFKPYRPDDSLDYMARELVNLKKDEELNDYREAIEELLQKTKLREELTKFIELDYQLMDKLNDWKIFGGSLNFLGMPVRLSADQVRKLVKLDYETLKLYCELVEIAQGIESEALFYKQLQEEAVKINRDEIYQKAKDLVGQMENFGRAKIEVEYDYFEDRARVQKIEYNRKLRSIREILSWYPKRIKSHVDWPSRFLESFIPAKKEILLMLGLEYLIEKNKTYMEHFIGQRRKIDFFLGGIRYIEEIKSVDLPLAFPSFTEEKWFSFRHLYHPCLLFQKEIQGREDMVPNDFHLSPPQSLIIITGPNDAGKTVFITSIGLFYCLGQNGFPVVAEEAQLSQLDGLYTHFVQSQDIALGEGMFYNELARAKQILRVSSGETLLLMDEFFRGTSPEDGEEMSLRFINGLIKKGAPVFLTSHYHRVAEKTESIEGVGNFQSEVKVQEKKIQPTYKMIPGRAGKSYGVEIAEQKLGLSEEHILKIAGYRVTQTGI